METPNEINNEINNNNISGTSEFNNNVGGTSAEFMDLSRRRATIGTTPVSSDEGLEGKGDPSADLWWRNKTAVSSLDKTTDASSKLGTAAPTEQQQTRFQPPRNRPDLTKTKLCDAYMKGHCGETNCRWAHGRHELRYTDEFYKTSLCRYWVESVCYAGDNCRHAHSVDELRERRATVGGPGSIGAKARISKARPVGAPATTSSAVTNIDDDSATQMMRSMHERAKMFAAMRAAANKEIPENELAGLWDVSGEAATPTSTLSASARPWTNTNPKPASAFEPFGHSGSMFTFIEPEEVVANRAADNLQNGPQTFNYEPAQNGEMLNSSKQVDYNNYGQPKQVDYESATLQQQYYHKPKSVGSGRSGLSSFSTAIGSFDDSPQSDVWLPLFPTNNDLQGVNPAEGDFGVAPGTPPDQAAAFLHENNQIDSTNDIQIGRFQARAPGPPPPLRVVQGFTTSKTSYDSSNGIPSSLGEAAVASQQRLPPASSIDEDHLASIWRTLNSELEEAPSPKSADWIQEKPPPSRKQLSAACCVDMSRPAQATSIALRNPTEEPQQSKGRCLRPTGLFVHFQSSGKSSGQNEMAT